MVYKCYNFIFDKKNCFQKTRERMYKSLLCPFILSRNFQTISPIQKYWSKYYADSIGHLEWVCDLESGFNLSSVCGSDIFHPSGTTRMAELPENGVVDSDLLVFGTNNLYVLSTSVFPNGASANPTMMLLLLALRLGDNLPETFNK